MRSGWLPEKFNANDKPYYYKGSKHRPEDFQYINLLKTNAAWLSDVYDQGDTNSCTANATAAAIRWLAHKHPNAGIPKEPSRLFIYYNGRALWDMDGAKNPKWPDKVVDEDSDDTNAGGSTVRHCMKSINLFGVAPDSSFPFENNLDAERLADIANAQQNGTRAEIIRSKYKWTVPQINDRPSDAAYQAATETHATEYCRLDPDYTYDLLALTEEEQFSVSMLTLLRLRQCLVEGYPVVFGLTWFEDYDDNFEEPDSTDDEGYWTLKAPPDYPKKLNAQTGKEERQPRKTHGGHTVLAIGFDHAMGRILVQSSWNQQSTWRNDKATYNRYFWVPYSHIYDYEATSDFWMVRLVEKQAKVPGSSLTREPNPVEVESPWTAIRPNVVNAGLPALGTASQIAVVYNNVVGAHIFWVSATGTVEHLMSNDGKTWKYSRVAEKDNAALHGALTAMITDTYRVELFWITPFGGIGSAQANVLDAIWHVYQPFGDANQWGEVAYGGLTTMIRGKNLALIWVTNGGRIVLAERSTLATLTPGLTASPEFAKWNVTEIAPSGSASDKDPRTSLASVCRNDKHAEVWWIGPEGSVESAYWFEGSSQWNHHQLAPKGSAAMRTRIAAVAYDGGSLHMEVYYITPNGSIRRHHWDGNWQPSTVIVGPSTPRTQLAGGKSEKKKLSDGSFYEDYGARVDSGITAVCSADGKSGVDVVWVSGNNSVLYWNEKKLGGEPGMVAGGGQATPGTPVGAVHSPQGDKFDTIFMCQEANDPIVIASS